MCPKRKHVTLDLSTKYEIIQRLESGENALSLAKIYNVGRTTINDIKKNHNKIQDYITKVETSDGDVTSRKTMKLAKYDQLDLVLFQWFVEQRNQGIPLTGPIIQEKAIYFNKKTNGDPLFKASLGWLHRFKSRHGIRQLNTEEGTSSADSSAATNFTDHVREKIKKLNLSDEQVYSCIKTVLNWKALPQQSSEISTKYEMKNEKVTVWACANVSGNHCLPLLIMGTGKEPKAFKHLNMELLPVQYHSKKNTRTTDQYIINDWFYNNFIPTVREYLRNLNLPGKALLLMDNLSTQPLEKLISDDGKITCESIPMDTTSLIQPMEEDVIQSLKRGYREKIICQFLCGEDDDMYQFWEKITIKDAIYCMAEAWNDIPKTTFQKYGCKLLSRDYSTVDEASHTSNTVIQELMPDVLKYENVDKNIISEWIETGLPNMEYNSCSDDELIEESETDDDDEENEINPIVNHKEAAEMLSKCIEWYEKQGEAKATELMLLRKIRYVASEKAHKEIIQKQETDFFVT